MPEDWSGPQGVISSEDARPLLSIVVTARNDDHGGGFLRRMQVFVNGLLEQTVRCGMNSELIIVEWNPPVDRPRLADALRWPSHAGPCTVRIIEVPPELHRRYAYSDKLGLFQMIAKNVGIRRSRGHFVLCTNVDVLFSSELVRFFATGRLRARLMYRVDRLDVSSDVPVGASVDEQLEFCRRHVVRVNIRWRTVRPDELGWIPALRRFWTAIADGLRGFLESLTLAMAAAVRAAVWVLTHPLESLTLPMAAAVRAVVWVLTHPFPNTVRVLRILWGETLLGPAVRKLRETLHRLQRLFEHRVMVLHTNACGDFTLLSRDDWFRLRGYPEWQMYSFHIDSVLCYMAHYSGIREVVLKRKMAVYHMDHHSGWSPEEADVLVTRMRSMSVPILDYEQLCSYVMTMHQRKPPLIANDESWGLASEDLLETDPVTRQTQHAEIAGSRGQAVTG